MTTSIAQPHRVAIAGASGRMGQMLAQALTEAADCQLVGAVDVADSVYIGNDATGFS
jgi:4-hydroxy-tetrahydrodipicolinate reductase